MKRPYDRMKIGILGLVPGAGTGFLSVSLARAMASSGLYRPAVIELGKGSLYDELGLSKRFAGREVFSFHRSVIKNQSIRGMQNEVDGVNWMVLPPGENFGAEELYQKLRLVNHGLGDSILCRLAGVNEEHLWKILWEMDRVIAVIDPLPSRLVAGYPLLSQLKSSELPIVYVVNKYNGGVDRKQLLDFIRVKHLFYVPMVPPEAIYSAEYTCQPAFDVPEAHKILEEPIWHLIDEIHL